MAVKQRDFPVCLVDVARLLQCQHGVISIIKVPGSPVNASTVASLARSRRLDPGFRSNGGPSIVLKEQNVTHSDHASVHLQDPQMR
jgi:hypothetical protein